MSSLGRGLYETLLTVALDSALERLDGRLRARRRGLAGAEAADRLALHLAGFVRRALADVDVEERAEVGVRLVRNLLERAVAELDGEAASNLSQELPRMPAEVLAAIHALQPDGMPREIEPPLTPLLDTTLLTNAPDEPRVGRQLEAEIDSADRIDAVMAFIRRSGLRQILGALRRHLGEGRPLRVLTSTFTGTTERAALDQLRDLGAEVRISYDTTTTRLHAKSWLFHRDSGYSTAFIGSSNLTYAAQVTGLEWNVRVAGARNPDVIEKFAAVFESYWESGDFVPYDPEQFREQEGKADDGPVFLLSPVELRLEPFQERLLEQIDLARAKGRHRNLLVSATGTGKTVMAAVDYARLRGSLEHARLLFVAHRKEILQQSRGTFRHALRDPAFGELWVDGEAPTRYEHVFASIQSLQRANLDLLDPGHFDVVIVDEFHHAAAQSYARLLDHLRPAELLGLTATPERSDGLSVLDHFDGRITAELRLWDAIDQQRLCPFLYFGVHDGLDLRQVRWRRGRGYDADDLTRALTSDDRWARVVLAQVEKHVDDPRKMRALGFCVGVRHAEFMADAFRKAGSKAVAVSGESPPEARARALSDLQAGRVQTVFCVDLFNEGVDLPAVDTLLFLRPTDSPTLFLQQLGRGLRKTRGKSACTVLDFVGQHRREFRIDRRFRALLGGTRDELIRHVAGGFPYLPAGCHMELDPVAREIVLANVKAAIPAQWQAKAKELAELARSEGGDLGLGTFLERSGLELEDVYRGSRGWSDLREEAGLRLAARGPEEKVLRRGCGRMLHVDDAQRIGAWRRLLSSERAPEAGSLSELDRRLLRMLVAPVADRALSKRETLEAGTELLWRHPQVRLELLDLLDVLEERRQHVTRPLEVLPDVPLQVHGRYSRLEILAAMGVGRDRARVSPWQSGVQYVEEARADLLAFTLDKTSGSFSPTTRYRDYAINRELIHWESQSVARADGETGLRYRRHADLGSHVLLFARHRQDERAFHFLGPATYVSHRSERPMQVTWRLRFPLPGDLFASFAAAVA